MESEIHYVLTNLKKNKKVNFGEGSPEPEEKKSKSPPIPRFTEKGTYSGLVKVPNDKGEP